MLEMICRNKMQFFALSIFLVMAVILAMIPSASAEDYDVSITDDMKFNPEDLTINVGDTVTWTNNDGMGHTATSTDEPASFDSENIAAGATWSFTFTEAGTYEYKCDYHSSMTASITVVESDDGDGDDDSDDGDGTDDSDDGDGANDTDENGEGESPDCDFVIGVDSTNYTFNPNLLSIKFGEVVCWQLNSYSGNVAQVSNSTSNAYVSGFRSGEANITFNSNNSFYVIFNSIYGYADNTTYYYISEPHAGLQMRGEIIIGTGSEAPDGDNDGISDDDDDCPEEDASGHDADADGCIDDSDNDGVKDDVDVCPFDPDDACEAVANDPQSEGECVEGDIKNEDCNACSCQSDPNGNWSWACTEMDCKAMKEDSPSVGFTVAVLSCLLVAIRRKL